MFEQLASYIPLEAQKLIVVLIASFLIGLQREEQKAETPQGYSFGGIRTFPLIGLTGYAVAMIAQGNPVALGLGFAVIGAFMLMSYKHKLDLFQGAGLTSEMSGLFTYLLGALVYQDRFWIAIALLVVGMLLLELKVGLERFARRVPAAEILTATKFLLLSVVILPILPNHPLTPLHINPFQTWLIVVAISALSYGGYILQKIIGDRGSVIVSAILGGVYSSTVITIVLARRGKSQTRPFLYSGAILASSGMTYIRLAILLCIFSEVLRREISLFLFILGAVTIGVGVLWSRHIVKHAAVEQDYEIKNPLEISSALIFALLFLTMTVITGLVISYSGSLGMYILAPLTGVTDVTPFVMTLTQSTGLSIPIKVGAAGVLISSASNNFIKGVYAYSFARGATGIQSLILLTLLAILGLAPLLYVFQGIAK